MSKRNDELWLGEKDRPTVPGFGEAFPEDELLHPKETVPGDWLTETWAYMFYVPEAGISSMIHIWVHPNLGVVTPNIAVWQGHKPLMIFAELLDGIAYRSSADLGDGSLLSFENGLKIEMIEPFRKMRITYEDATRENRLDLLVTDHSPPVMRGNRKHFDQATRHEGTLTLRGKTYAIHPFGMRDRSWGENRTEGKIAFPPIGWLNGTFPDSGMSWLIAATDDPKRNPEWLGLFDVAERDVVHDAWLFRDGVLSRPRAVSKITHRTHDDFRPLRHDIYFEDEQGREYRITGKVISSLPWNSWPNLGCFICSTEWQWDGETGFGDTQETYWCDYPQRMQRL